ncbi:hypothetical protein H8959_005703, partial [Pygathrix nigripes]
MGLGNMQQSQQSSKERASQKVMVDIYAFPKSQWNFTSLGGTCISGPGRQCFLEDGASKGAWLNRSSIIFAGGDKWSVDPRVSISTLNKRDYSLQIQNVDVTDDGPYTCSVQTQHTPRTMQVHLTVQ